MHVEAAGKPVNLVFAQAVKAALLAVVNAVL